jgi:hypothetical protein
MDGTSVRHAWHTAHKRARGDGHLCHAAAIVAFSDAGYSILLA